MKQNLLLLFALCGISYAHAQDNKGLIINEIMQSNVETIMDDLNEFPDSWVELYNASDAEVNLKDYAIGTKTKANKAWQLPDKTVASKGYAIIYCDKEGIENNRLHADFRLESGKGCVVYLFKNKEIVDSLPEALKKMPAPDIAYGRKTDGANEWGYQLTPTAGKANTGEICDAKHILGAPVFSEKGRATSSKDAINLELSLPEKAPEGAYITYTTNGSEPTPQDTKYSQAINISKTTIIRAKVFCDGYLSPMSTAQSYIFHPRSWTLPIVSFQTNDKYLWDKKIGLFENNNSKADKKTHDWRRPMNIEFFFEEGKESVINQIGEFRIQGGQSRENALQSMALYANKRFDPDQKRFSYEFFPDQKPGITEFKSISLRDGGNDFTDMFFRDAIIQRTMGSHVDLDWQAYRTIVIYINGEYRGILNIRERSNEDNIYSNYNGLEDLDMIEISHEKDEKTQKDLFIEELKEGSDEFYNAFKTFYSEKGHTKAEYEQWLDVSEYLNVMVLNLFYGNLDFPGNNLVFWRPNDDDTESGLPKRWRVIVKDTDFGLGLYNRSSDVNTIDMIYNPSKHSDNWAFSDVATRLFRNMMDNEDLLQMFIDKSCVFMGDFMNAEGTGEIIDKIKDEVMDEFVEHRKLKGIRSKSKKNYGGGNRDQLNQKFEDAKKWLSGYTEKSYNWWTGKEETRVVPSRSDYFLNYMSSQWKLGDAIPVTINKDTNEMPDSVIVNDIPLSKGIFDGKLFPNRLITVSGIAPEGKSIKEWEVVITNAAGSTTTEKKEGAEFSMTMPTCKSLAIKAILGEGSGIDAAVTYSWKWKRTVGGVNVTNVPDGEKVSLYDLRGVLLEEAISNGSDIFLPAAAGQLFILKVGSESVKIK